MARFKRVFIRTAQRLSSYLEARGLAPQHLENRILESFKVSRSEFRLILGAVVLGALVVFLLKLGPSKNKAPSDLEDITTVIPKGFVLVPIDLRNYESLDSILGRMGQMDLFVKYPNQKKVLFVENAKVLRAPRNPSVLAVLTPEGEASNLLKGNEIGLYGVMKNRSETGTRFVTQGKTTSGQKKNRISYASEE